MLEQGGCNPKVVVGMRACLLVVLIVVRLPHKCRVCSVNSHDWQYDEWIVNPASFRETQYAALAGISADGMTRRTALFTSVPVLLNGLTSTTTGKREDGVRSDWAFDSRIRVPTDGRLLKRVNVVTENENNVEVPTSQNTFVVSSFTRSGIVIDKQKQRERKRLAKASQKLSIFM